MEGNKEELHRHVVDEELELLSAFFGLNGESCQLTARTPRTIIEVTQLLKGAATSCKTTFEIDTQNYPEHNAPNISISCSDARFSRSDALRVTEKLSSDAEALIGN